MHRKFKTILTTALILLLALSISAAGTRTRGKHIKFGQTVDIHLGRAGVSFTDSQYNGTVTLKRSDKGNAPGEDGPKFIQDLLDVRLTNADDMRVTYVVGAVYVYFKVKPAEVRQWNNGQLAVYYFDPWTQAWTKCNTMEIVDRGRISRLGCRIRVFGLYGLGQN